MFSRFERMIAMRYLLAKKSESFVSVIAGFSFIGILLGVATLIIVMAVMNGFRAEAIGRILGLNGHLLVSNGSAGIVSYQDTKSAIETVPGVVHVTPTIESQALVIDGGQATGVVLRGITREDAMAKPSLFEGVKAGAWQDYAGERIAIGHRLASRLGVRPGDQLTLISPRGKTSPFGTLPRQMAVDIAVIFDVGMYEYDSGFVFLPLELAQRFTGLKGKITALDVQLDDPEKELWMRKDQVGQRINHSYRVVDWQQIHGAFVGSLQVERNVMFLILSLIILVAAFNIISSLIMLVKDKSQDIAILRSMGASRAMIMRIFFMTGASIGVIGTCAGVMLGVAFADNIEAIRQFLQHNFNIVLFPAEVYFLSEMPSKIETPEVIAVASMALGLSFLATIFPAWRAAKLDPVEALRYG